MSENHRISRQTSGYGPTRLTWLVCSCGWKGQSLPAWNDYREALLKDQERKHMREARSKK